ncbi:MAG: prepilin-type N-terminal cleavage/methylation domain-containing protein [Candidatus Zixiibacteriota bacterium]|nr:MAG: prepilin-type N-terminal cleavage/methylation domain-containing protein [candidate division Zixibacteria bacterium]
MKKGIFSNRGITLIEIIVAVVIVAIAAAMAAPRFQVAIDRAKFRSTTRDIVSTLRDARSRAISEKQNFGVYFHPYPATVTFFVEEGTNPTALDVLDSVITIDTLCNETGSYFNFIWDLELSSPSFPITFSPDGSASNGGDIWILASSETSVGLTELHILSATGRITVDSYYY